MSARHRGDARVFIARSTAHAAATGFLLSLGRLRVPVFLSDRRGIVIDKFNMRRSGFVGIDGVPVGVNALPGVTCERCAERVRPAVPFWGGVVDQPPATTDANLCAVPRSIQ
jgi:hypothetical protein